MTPDEMLGGAFAEVRDGETVETIIRPAALTAAAEQPTDDPRAGGVVVVALPAAGDPVQDIGPEQKHATLLYYGDFTDNPDLTDEFRTHLSSVLAQVAENTPPFTEQVDEGPEGLGDDGAVVWLLGDNALPGLRERILDTDSEVAGPLDNVEQYPSFTPHVTIGYMPDGEDVPDASPDAPVLDEDIDNARDVESITFDRLALWWGDEQTEWPLTGAADSSEEPPMTTETAPSASYATTAAPEPPDAPAAPENAPDAVPAETGGPFYGILAPEGVVSGDGRQFAPESMTSRTLPIPLMAQDAQDDGHDGAVRVGLVTHIWRDTETYATPMIRYSGDWDVSDNAVEAKRQVDAGVARGVSVDGTDVTSRLIGSDGTEVDPMGETPADGVVIQVADEVKAAGLTICSVPAFEQAYIANGRLEDRTDPEPGQDPTQPLPTSPGDAVEEDDPTMVASAAPAWTIGLTAAAMGEGSWVVPAAHFTDPGLTEPTALTVTPEGRVYGHLATWGQCHLNTSAGRRGEQVRAAGKCMEVPVSASNYAYFGTGVVHTDDGGTVNVGSLTMETGHANLRYGALDAMAHYDNTGAVVADITVGHDSIGIWFSGHMRPTATEAQVYALTASGSVSGDWREIVRGSRQLELVAALVVNVPGFPIGRPAVTAAAGGPVALVASGVVQPEHRPLEIGDAVAKVTLDQSALVVSITEQVMASITRQQRASAASARVRSHRVAALAARLNRSA